MITDEYLNIAWAIYWFVVVLQVVIIALLIIAIKRLDKD